MRILVFLAVALSTLTPVLGGLDGINYSVRSGPDWAPTNDKCKSADEIARDLSTLARITNRIRIFSLTDCNAARLVLPAAKAIGVSVALGLWVSADDAVFQAEKAELQALLQREDLVSSSVVSSIHVGSEAVYRGDITAAKSIALFSEIKQIVSTSALKAPVTIAEVGDTYLAHPELTDAVREGDGLCCSSTTDACSAGRLCFRQHVPVLGERGYCKRVDLHERAHGSSDRRSSTTRQERRDR
ncbi:hypothetical protein PINS_up006788 [Pythium insidiosum]|nr:hypothetical protein PINS_up006788 [Pythium insidiosum]